MTTYFIRRLIQAAIVVTIVTWLVFLAMHLLPGDPVYIYISRAEAEAITPQQLSALRHQFGLDRPLYVQYADWMAGLFQGEWGKSLFYHEDVGKLIRERLPISLHLNLISFILVSAVGWLLAERETLP